MIAVESVSGVVAIAGLACCSFLYRACLPFHRFTPGQVCTRDESRGCAQNRTLSGESVVVRLSAWFIELTWPI